jgi:hypothetical protein
LSALALPVVLSLKRQARFECNRCQIWYDK